MNEDNSKGKLFEMVGSLGSMCSTDRRGPFLRPH